MMHASFHSFCVVFSFINLCFSSSHMQVLYETLIRQDELLAYIEKQDKNKFRKKRFCF
uniref:Uncharacterized protein n=1 Tax=Aegilops tauschii subsp. strangulata TaxID=200361 RepID=A0A453FA23_AEGTS